MARKTFTPRAIMESVYWWGPPTLFGCEVDSDASSCDIALVGVPHSTGNGSTERDQHLGPRALRNVSCNYRRVHRRFALDPWEACRIHDLGDVVMPEFLVSDRTIKDIEAFFRLIDAAGARPVSIGGDHSITLPILRAVAGKEARVGRKVALVQLDAHLDTYENFPWFGVTDSAAHWASKAVLEGLVDPAHSVQLGRRGNVSAWAAANISDELGYRVIWKEEFDELGIDATHREIRQRVGDLPVYISFDLDVLDPTVAPGVSNIEIGEEGMTINEALRTLQLLRGLEIIGADVVCMMPTKDHPNNITALNATAIMFEEICLIADNLAAAGSGR